MSGLWSPPKCLGLIATGSLGKAKRSRAAVPADVLADCALACPRLSFAFGTTFLSFFRTTTPHDRNFRKSLAQIPHPDPVAAQKVRYMYVLSVTNTYVMLSGFSSSALFGTNPDVLGMASASWRVKRAIFQGNGTFWSMETQTFLARTKL